MSWQRSWRDRGRKQADGTPHIQKGGGGISATPRVPLQDCSMKVNLGRKLQFPTEITNTRLRPDIVMWSSSSKAVLLVELTISWEAGLEAAWERKRLKYADLAAESTEAG